MASLSLLLVGYLVLAADLGTILGASDGSGAEEMEKDELLGLFDVMSSLLEDQSWVQMHPQPCTATPWPGVECELGEEEEPPLFHVTKVHIGPDILNPPCSSSAFLSRSLVKLPFLKTLSIFNCFTTSRVSLSPSFFTSFSYLEHLTLQSNPTLIGKIPPPPPPLSQAPNLKVLCLKQNGFHGEIPQQLGGLASLEQLDLSYNNLSGQIPQEFGGLKSLTILDLSWNSLEGQLPSSLGNLRLLQKTDLSSNMLNGMIPPELGNLESLVLLDLSYNMLSGPIPSSFSCLENLEYFLIDHNPINSELPLLLSTLKKLKTLSFSDCGLTGTVPTYFPSLKNLTALFLNRNNLSGGVPKNLATLPNLDQLNLSQNQLSGELSLPEGFIYRLGKRGLSKQKSCDSEKYSPSLSAIVSEKQGHVKPNSFGISASVFTGEDGHGRLI
ncbi:hypothetical protein Nepgr_003313 [Nepenthes gracilis]|uniref:Disease resistance R13L4/SHOC-2-like LRR domain-containing protein n=1 Tax=Nepenthes gracilis TaxID=150966 RepID=A0AAD3RZE0_NEPGR|nr:hypothetical protein Nepgr_003313 [Nepenthes gracilis]